MVGGSRYRWNVPLEMLRLEKHKLPLPLRIYPAKNNIKYPIETSFFPINLTLKHFRAAVANAYIGSLNSLHTFLKKYLYYMLVEFEQNRLAQTRRNFELFENKQTIKQKQKAKFNFFD